MSNQIYVGLHEQNEVKFIGKFTQKGWIVFDIGANAGFYSLLFSKKCWNGKIIAFEPSGREWRRLLEHIEINHCKNIVAENLAVGDCSRTMQLYIHEEQNMGMNSLKPDNRFRYIDKEPIKMISLDQYFSEHHELKALDFIKIDVEGFESEVVEGARDILLKFKPIVLCEVWEHMGKTFGEGLKLCTVSKKLISFGYVPNLIDSSGNPASITDNIVIDQNNILFIHSEKIHKYRN